MQQIPLQAIPNQSFTVQLDDRFYNMALKTANGIMALDISRDNQVLLTGARVVAGTPLLPYNYLENSSGNFIFITANEELPDYAQFGVTQSLLYASNDELEAIRGG